MAKKRIILIDLDGVLNEYTGNFEENHIPPVKEGAKEFLENLSQEYTIHIFTTRNRLLTSKWLMENNLNQFVEDVTNTKIPAYLYIDDRCVRFEGNFKTTLDEIKNFKVYWK